MGFKYYGNDTGSQSESMKRDFSSFIATIASLDTNLRMILLRIIESSTLIDDQGIYFTLYSLTSLPNWSAEYE